MTRLEFSEMYPYAVDGSRRSAIFGEKKALLVKILQQGSPVYQDTFIMAMQKNQTTLRK